MNKTLLGLGVVALLAVAVLGVTLPKTDLASKGAQGQQGVQGERGPAGQSVQGPQGERGPAGSAGQSVQGLESLLSALSDLLTELKNQASKLGATPGTNLPNPYCQGNLCTEVVSGTCNDASSTLAVIAPFSLKVASSTAISATLDITNGTTSARFTLATSTRSGAPAVSTATSTGLFSKVLVGVGATTTLNSDSMASVSKNDRNTPSVPVEIGPRLQAGTTTPETVLVLYATANGEESLAGITNLNNNFSCTYNVEFKGRR